VSAIGARVLNEACVAAADWAEVVPERPPTVSVNVSAQELSTPDFVDHVAGTLRRAGLRPDRLCLEITESALVEGEHPLDAVRRLKALGVSISLDDFGTGYSSLGRLKHLPLDEVKIDRSFVAGMVERREDELIVTCVIGLAQGLGLRVVAEGVETAAQLAQLRARGCNAAQGYLLGSPMSLESATEVATAGRPFGDLPSGETSAAVPTPEPELALSGGAAVSLLGHELAGSLTALRLGADAIDENDPDTWRNAAMILRRAALRTAATIDLVQDVAEADAGGLTLSREPTAIAEVVRSAVEIARSTVELDPVIDVPDAVVLADRARLATALANLLTNAAKHGHTSAVRVIASVRGGQVLIEVLDDGPGVPLEALGRIFRMFGRGSSAAPGSGLGLYLARAVARAHGGDVRYRVVPGGGSNFVLEVPLGGSNGKS
jgi:EAL domain-containing protein (putative c-di-GMP-specific phosphodiesterase class I)/anti-sigma regulatory factor (Ser/Thr protein kinase)